MELPNGLTPSFLSSFVPDIVQATLVYQFSGSLRFTHIYMFCVLSVSLRWAALDTTGRKICHISSVSIHSTRWIEAFRQKGYSLSLITDFETWVAQRPQGVPIYVLPSLFFRNVQRRLVPNYVSIVKILRQIRPDLVHLHVLHHYAPPVKFSRVPYVLHSWGMEVLELSRMDLFRRVLSMWAATRARKIIVDAEVMKRIWTSVGIPNNMVEVIPFGVDTDLFSPDVDGGVVRENLNVDDGDIVVVSTRPFFPHYDIDCLIRALPIVVGRRKKVKFLIKGKGPLEGAIRKLARKLHVDPYVRFTSPVPYRDVPRYLAAADIYVSTSFVDSTSVSLLEAMACGLPVVTTDIAGNREWIADGVNGMLYPPGDHSALADKISQLVEDESLRRRFGERSRRIVLERAVWEKCVSRMEAVYQSI